jgi:hypothetical protein
VGWGSPEGEECIRVVIIILFSLKHRALGLDISYVFVCLRKKMGSKEACITDRGVVLYLRVASGRR